MNIVYPRSFILGFLYFHKHKYLALVITPQIKIFLSQRFNQIPHSHFNRAVSIYFNPFVNGDNNQNGDYHQAKSTIHTKRSNEQPIALYERILRVIDFWLVDDLNDWKYARSSKQAHGHLEERPWRSWRNHRSHRIDETDVSSHDQSRSSNFVAADLVRGRWSTVKKLDKSDKRQEENGYAELNYSP